MAELDYKDYIANVSVTNVGVISTFFDFNAVILLVPLASNSMAGLDAEAFGSEDSTYVEIFDTGKLNTANNNTAGSFSAATISAVTAFFAQRPKPKSITIIAVDLVGGDTYASILQTYLDAGRDFFYVTSINRTDSISVAICNALAALDRKRLHIFQNAGSTIIAASGTYAAGTFGTAFTSKEYGLGLYKADTEYDDMKYTGQLASVNPLTDPCPPGDLIFQLASASSATSGQQTNAETNFWNINAKAGNDNITEPGVTLDGYPIYQTLAAEGFSEAVRQMFLTEKIQLSKKKRKWPMTNAQNTINAAKVATIFYDFCNRDYFDKTQDHFITGETVTDTDKALEMFRITAEMQYLKSARKLAFRGYAA